MSATSLLDEVYAAQTRNSTLAGDSLRRAGQEIAAVAISHDLCVAAADVAGERLVGAALLADERVRPVDVSRRLDGMSVLLVAGHIAGTTGLAQSAERARSLGAVRVEGAVIGDHPGSVPGCDAISEISSSRPGLVAL